VISQFHKQYPAYAKTTVKTVFIPWTNRAQDWTNAVDDEERDSIATQEDAAVMRLRVTNAIPATLLVSPRSSVEFAGRAEIATLLRVAEMGLDLSAAREQLREQSDQSKS